MNIEGLMENPSNLFDELDFEDDLPQQVQNDLKQSILSLSYSAPTGSVFLSLRAVENRLREWYEVETSNDIENRTFGQVIGELDDHFESSDRPPILTHLDYLKTRRNEVAHPEKTATIQEAENTLVNVRETISKIHEHIE